MQPGGLTRLPWHRPTYAANMIAGRGYQPGFAAHLPLELPQYGEVREFLSGNGVCAPSLAEENLRERTGIVAATALEFERILSIIRPTLAFVVTYYAELGPAFMLACRRMGILSIDLQHCPQEGAHKAYDWLAVPSAGYATLPAVFWNWTASDAAAIGRWTGALAQPWHRSVYGGNRQIAPFLDSQDPQSMAADRRFDTVTGGVPSERDILVALQPIGGQRALWAQLAAQIKASPPNWRWWIRRHPAASPVQDTEYACLLALRQANVNIEEATSLPLPALLRHMSALVSLSSGAAVEASMFGVPAFFLSSEARGAFSSLIERGGASVLDVKSLIEALSRSPRAREKLSPTAPPDLDALLLDLEALAVGYKEMCELDRRRARG
jgi:hypothetical protein